MRPWRRRPSDEEFAAEVEAHLAHEVDEQIDRGLPAAEARYAALRRFGNVTRHLERFREASPWFWLETVWQDVRCGCRSIKRSPAPSLAAVLSLALGVAANSTIFSAVNGWMLRPPRIDDPGRVVVVSMTDPAKAGFGWDRNPVSAPDFTAWREQSRSFAGMVASEWTDFTLTGGAEPERLGGLRVSTDYFQVLGVHPALGRTFLPGEDRPGHARVVILSHRLWQGRFGSDPNVMRKPVRLDGESATVVGIMPSRFRVGYQGPQLWTPLVLPAERLVPATRGDRSLRVLARLKAGVSVEAAQAEVATLAQRADRTSSGTTRGWGATAIVLQDFLANEFKLGMSIQMGAVLLVWLIACANIAGLQLTRAAARQTEIAVRAALGASRVRLVRQLLVESLLIALLGGSLGVLLSLWGVAAFRRGLNWEESVREMALEVTIDGYVLAYALGISVLAAVLFGLGPALRQTAGSVQSALKDAGRTMSQGRRRRRGSSVLVATQVALALALLGAAGLFVSGILHRVHAGFGIDPTQVLTANVHLTNARYKEPSTRVAFFQEAIDRLDALPGVVSAGGTTSLVPSAVEYAPVATFRMEGQAVLPLSERARTEYVSVSPRFLRTLRVPLLGGRNLAASDDARGPSVVVVNRAFARRYLPNVEPLGKRLRLDTDDADRHDWSEIVGVVGDVREWAWEDEPRVYESYLQRPSAAMTVVVRTSTAPEAVASLLRRVIWTLDKDQPITRVQTMEQVVADTLGGDIVVTTLIGSFAGMALAMAVVGVFGVVAYTVEQRTQEIGIRVALGARSRDILQMIARRGIVLGGVGVGCGLALSAPLVWGDTGMAPAMPVGQRVSVFLAAGVLIWVVTLLASYIPARRAVRIDPTVALRYE